MSLWTVLAAGFFGPAGSMVMAEDVDQTPLAVKPVRAYPNLRLDRPVIIDNAGDGTGRLFVAGQRGLVWILPEDEQSDQTTTFLDIRDRVVYKDRENEEGFLGLAFHPNYQQNGEFFVYYTTASEPHTSVISRFRVSDDPNRADPDSEEEIMRISQPFWNHNGGTIKFGPDGYLYIGLGDGGKANDPMMNGQNVQTWLGSLLRIDVDRQSDGRKYGIPADNPFANAGDLARPEIYAYGFRNIWRFSFDKPTGLLWAADVGQNLWEEINIVQRGGNYGWNLREAQHPFGPAGSDARPDLIDPIWEYHHDLGKSITGGHVYRGSKVPELQGAYLYADYVTGRFWALWYDAAEGKVLANRELESNKMPIMTFGVSEDNELFCSDAFGMLYRFEGS